MPPKAPGRGGIQLLAAAGEEWETAKVADLQRTFGTPALIQPAQTEQQVDLATGLAAITPQTQFLVQAQFDVTEPFKVAVGVAQLCRDTNMSFGQLRPDLLQIFRSGVDQFEVNPDGTTTPLDNGDQRLRLRVIDIKLTAEPSVSYMAEVTYYSMALAAWLRANGRDQSFVVISDAAVWPGSHDASALSRFFQEQRVIGATPSNSDLLARLEEDIEPIPFGVFAARLRQFFRAELPSVLAHDWAALPWHVDNRCAGCEYLGYTWGETQAHPLHCYPTAKGTDHISRVAFVTRGARRALEEATITSVAQLATVAPEHAAFESHHELRATRAAVNGRALSLTNQTASVVSDTGTSAIMPRWADLRLYLSADFDVGSGISLCFGLHGFWAASADRARSLGSHTGRLRSRVFTVDTRSLDREREELIAFLREVAASMVTVEAAVKNATMQVYIWDRVTFEHLSRVVGRHLASILAEDAIRGLAWLFPPPDIQQNHEMSDRQSPITIVRDVVKALVAIPSPHYYSLLNTARSYFPSSSRNPTFQVHTFFEDPFSDQIPSERVHAIWQRAHGAHPWQEQMRHAEETVLMKLAALTSVCDRLVEDLGNRLQQTAPRIADVKPPTLPATMSEDARLWYIHACLNVALEKLDVQLSRAMPPEEREARFRSARLIRRLEGTEASGALLRLNIAPDENTVVYVLSSASREVKARDGDFNFALCPRGRGDFLEQTWARIAGNEPSAACQQIYTRMEQITAVTIVAIDRDNGCIVLKLSRGEAVRYLEREGVVDFSREVMLDPVHKDFLLKRLEPTLRAIGNPANAPRDASVLRALASRRMGRRSNPSPAGNFLWSAPEIATANSGRNVAEARTALEVAEINLNPSQWDAWQHILTHRLSLMWGPPGTGKSRTLQAVIHGALISARLSNTPVNVLLSGLTYEAIDNVLLPVMDQLADGPLADANVRVRRMRSWSRKPIPECIGDADVPREQERFAQLATELEAGGASYLVSGPPQMVHELTKSRGHLPQDRLFHFIVVDEASQVDVANAVMILTAARDDASAVFAGDPKQMPPIHQATPPQGLEAVVGSVFTYFEKRYRIPVQALNENYRSNSAIVGIAHLAGYRRTLRAVNPDRNVVFASPLPTSQPANWPGHLEWTQGLCEILAPSKRAVCLVYPDGRSSQSNAFEADLIASISALLNGRLGQRTAAGISEPYTVKDLWHEGIGIVTPHRAQQSMVITALRRTFPNHPPEAIRSAVDTVERFQGGERDVMLASFGVGDPDAIANEEEFLMSLQRFNVMSSRARSKLVVLISRELVDHLASEMSVLHESALLKSYVEAYCNQAMPLTLTRARGAGQENVAAALRWQA